MLRVIGSNSSEHGFVASELERIAIESIAAARLPEPKRNYTIVVGGRRFIVDLAWPDYSFGIDLDGRAYHQDRFDEDRKRDVTLSLHGWEVHRYTWKHATAERAWMIAPASAPPSARAGALGLMESRGPDSSLGPRKPGKPTGCWPLQACWPT